jgi:hypothetical protein
VRALTPGPEYAEQHEHNPANQPAAVHRQSVARAGARSARLARRSRSPRRLSVRSSGSSDLQRPSSSRRRLASAARAASKSCRSHASTYARAAATAAEFC